MAVEDSVRFMTTTTTNTTPVDLATAFDAVYVLNLPRRTDRLAQFNAEIKRIEWPFKTPRVFAATDAKELPGKDGYWANLLSHRSLLKKALDDGSKTVLVLEDDVVFRDDFVARVTEFLSVVPDDWDQLMFGGRNVKSTIQPQPKYRRCYGAEGLFATAFSALFAAHVSEVWQAAIDSGSIKGTNACELMATEHKTAKVFAPVRFVAGVRGGQSDLSGSFDPRRRFFS